jgi:hypothetical protein
VVQRYTGLDLHLGGAALQRCEKVALRKMALAAEGGMAAPHRGNAGFGTYFITPATFQKHSLFQSDRMADLFVQVLPPALVPSPSAASC